MRKKRNGSNTYQVLRCVETFVSIRAIAVEENGGRLEYLHQPDVLCLRHVWQVSHLLHVKHVTSNAMLLQHFTEAVEVWNFSNGGFEGDKRQPTSRRPDHLESHSVAWINNFPLREENKMPVSEFVRFDVNE